MLTITVNGESRHMKAGSTLTDLLRELGLNSLQVAIERNREVVPRAQHPTTQLADHDALEIVTFVGGG